MKELLLVSIGSFFGGGLRYLVSKVVSTLVATALPLPTLIVNVVGCFLIGLLSGMSLANNISPTTKLLLTTGFCGGFTTFSTFMNENLLLARGSQLPLSFGYTILSIILGLAALMLGYKVTNA